MSFWNWFSSERRISEALEKSNGYDISPIIIHPPANTDVDLKNEEGGLTLWTDYAYKSEETDNDTSGDVWADINIRK